MSNKPRPQKANRGPTRAKPNGKAGPTPHPETCGFCGKHRNQVPLFVMSPVTNHTICAYCAMTIVTQSMEHMTKVTAAFNQVVQEKPDWFARDEKTGAISLINPEKVADEAIDAANDDEEEPDGDG